MVENRVGNNADDQPDKAAHHRREWQHHPADDQRQIKRKHDRHRGQNAFGVAGSGL